VEYHRAWEIATRECGEWRYVLVQRLRQVDNSFRKAHLRRRELECVIRFRHLIGHLQCELLRCLQVLQDKLDSILRKGGCGDYGWNASSQKGRVTRSHGMRQITQSDEWSWLLP
jgi:hypothetical protein